MNKQGLVLVAGAGGFIGGALASDLYQAGFENIRAVDIKPLDDWYQRVDAIDNRVLDLSDQAACFAAANGVQYVFNLAADMGGMGFIENNRALCMLSVLTNTHLLLAGKEFGVER